MYGTVKFYSFERGFGFITLDETGEDIFFHCKQVEGYNNGPIDAGSRCKVEGTMLDAGNRPKASKVTIL